jgi:hypothetical protein
VQIFAVSCSVAGGFTTKKHDPLPEQNYGESLVETSARRESGLRIKSTDQETDTSVRIAVMGAGAIGLLYGGWLQQAGADVSFIARGERLDALRTSAVTAKGDLPFKLEHVHAVSRPEEISPVDAILLCVKLYDLHSAATCALPALKPGDADCDPERRQRIRDAKAAAATWADRRRPGLFRDQTHRSGFSVLWRVGARDHRQSHVRYQR